MYTLGEFSFHHTEYTEDWLDAERYNDWPNSHYLSLGEVQLHLLQKYEHFLCYPSIPFLIFLLIVGSVRRCFNDLWT